jgi:hypothetical protein
MKSREWIMLGGLALSLLAFQPAVFDQTGEGSDVTEIGKTCGAISDPVPAPGKLRRTDVMFGKTEAICEKIIGISGRIGKTGAKTVGIFVTTWPAAEATDAKHS